MALKVFQAFYRDPVGASDKNLVIRFGDGTPDEAAVVPSLASAGARLQAKIGANTFQAFEFQQRGLSSWEMLLFTS